MMRKFERLTMLKVTAFHDLISTSPGSIACDVNTILSQQGENQAKGLSEKKALSVLLKGVGQITHLWANSW